MSKRTLIICDVCGERKAKDCCIVCDADICPEHGRHVTWHMYAPAETEDAPKVVSGVTVYGPTLIIPIGPLCPDCHGYAFTRWNLSRGGLHEWFGDRFEAAVCNTAACIVREHCRPSAIREKKEPTS